MSNEKGFDPTSHVHKGIDSLSKPGVIHRRGDTMAWAYDPSKLAPNIQADLLEIDRLLTLGNLSKDEREAIAAEVTLSTAYNDHFGLSYVIRYLQTGIGTKAQGRSDVLKMIAGFNQKISVPTTLQKVRHMISNRGKKEEESEAEAAEG